MRDAKLVEGDCLDILPTLESESFDVIFADPPYFLSGSGSTCKGGNRAPVSKGSWDKPLAYEDVHDFNLAWLSECRRLLSPSGTIWVSGTYHSILSCGFAMQSLGFRILNDVIWRKPNPPPNLGCRTFTHSTETIIWASKGPKAKHVYNYARMKAENGGKQLKNVWDFTAPKKSERTLGRHPTQKPIALLERVLDASAPAQARVLDPFCGSGTTGVAALARGFEFLGIDASPEYLDIAMARMSAA